MPRPTNACRLVLAGLAVLAMPPAVLDGQATKFENFSATTANLAVGNGEPLRINVSTWTPAAERDKAVAALQQGLEPLLELLKAAPSHGYIWTSESLGYTLRYAHKAALPNGGERIVLAVDRPLGGWSRSVWKAAGAQGSDDPQMTVIEIRLNRQGRGEGKMSLAAKVGADAAAGTLALEGYDAAPVLLKQAARVAGPSGQ